MTATTATGADLDAAVLRRRTAATQEHFAVVEEKEKEKPLKPVGGLPGGFIEVGFRLIVDGWIGLSEATRWIRYRELGSTDTFYCARILY